MVSARASTKAAQTRSTHIWSRARSSINIPGPAIQALAAVAQLSPESQRRRFVEKYPDVFGSVLPQRLDVYLIAPEPPAHGIRPKLLLQAVALAEDLHANGSIGPAIRRTAFLETRMGEDGLVFERTQRWDFAATAPSTGSPRADRRPPGPGRSMPILHARAATQGQPSGPAEGRREAVSLEEANTSGTMGLTPGVCACEAMGAHHEEPSGSW